jgi:cyclophilin family peptidyl-prolyl cis-trans isomerase
MHRRARSIHGTDRTPPKLSVNENFTGARRSNTRGTASFAHWDVPDAGAAEFFINLGANAHLDEAYGGYCVFAAVDAADAASFGVVDQIAEAVKAGSKVAVLEVSVVGGEGEL